MAGGFGVCRTFLGGAVLFLRFKESGTFSDGREDFADWLQLERMLGFRWWRPTTRTDRCEDMPMPSDGMFVIQTGIDFHRHEDRMNS